jgi:hypothetical protein
MRTGAASAAISANWAIAGEHAPIETADSRGDLRGFKTELLEFRVLIGDPRRGGFEDH